MTSSPFLQFQNTLTSELDFIFEDVSTTPFSDNFLIAYSPETAELLSLAQNIDQHEDFIKIFSGEMLPEGARHTAQVYAGHQFGHFVPQLGDGRSISLGEITNNQKTQYDLQLKGSGPTPYSRMADGRAVVRSCIREFLASEAFAALGIPTTRALCITATNDKVYRESAEQGAIMTRVTESNIRFGHFEFFFHHNRLAELDQLANYCLKYLYPECLRAPQPHLAMLMAIVERTASLMAKWQAFGFAHGVMNTDNMSILGLTIDYGPFGFLDQFESGFICNHSDHQGRYAFEQQPSIGLWNLNALAYTFSRWLQPDDIRQVLENYEPQLIKTYNHLMQQKLGLESWQDDDKHLLGRLLGIMEEQKADYSLSFRLLNSVFIADSTNSQCQALIALFASPEKITAWLTTYRARLQQQSLKCDERIKQQNLANPKYILRNYLAETAIRSANAGDYSEIETLRQLLTNPYDEQPNMHAYAKVPPIWGKKLEISCSS
ncbi:MAG: protein adenylyltransferase SelO [Thalassotalea sp.]